MTPRRALDVVIAAGSLVVLSPLLLIGATGILLSDRGPILYRARRVGVRGRIFTMFKFRTMRMTEGSVITARRDPRVFFWGRVLRETKIDELPQLFNIVTGDMAIVGPRPEDPTIVEQFYTPRQRETLEVPPGLTSPGTIYAYTHGETMLDAVDPVPLYVRSLLPTKLALDTLYVRNPSLLYDLRLIARTLYVVILRLLGKREFALPPEFAAAGELSHACRGSGADDPQTHVGRT